MFSRLTSQGQIPNQGAPSMFSRLNTETPNLPPEPGAEWWRDMDEGRGPVSEPKAARWATLSGKVSRQQPRVCRLWEAQKGWSLVVTWVG